jgi:hypothetical protein
MTDLITEKMIASSTPDTELAAIAEKVRLQRITDRNAVLFEKESFFLGSQ